MYTDNFIAIADYAKKYGLGIQLVTQACSAYGKNNACGLISQRRRKYLEDGTLDPDVSHCNYIFDAPPVDHPGWGAWNHQREVRAKRELKRCSLAVHAKDYLERYDTRVEQDRTTFYGEELANIVGVPQNVISYWSEIGEDGFGRLPRVNTKGETLVGIHGKAMHPAKTKKQMRFAGHSYYYLHKDIRRFFKGEFKDGVVLGNSIDDKLTRSITNSNDLAEDAGYFVYNPAKAYPMNIQGFLDWVKRSIFMNDRKSRTKVPLIPTDKQVEFYRNAFALDKNGGFKHKIICACRPRGDYKSFDITLLFLFRFFNMPEEQIFLVTNSLEQTSHLLYKEALKIIKRSPVLSSTPGLEIQTKGIYLMAGKGKDNIFNSIELTSVEGGARSNGTCFACSEVWKMAKDDETGIAEIEQSIRGVDNGWFLGESTVAPKGHFFHRYYESHLMGDNPVLYFQYYSGDERRNPKIDTDYLNHVRKIWPFHYKMFFDNRWEDAAINLFPAERVEEMGYLGMNHSLMRGDEVKSTIAKMHEYREHIRRYEGAMDASHEKAELRLLETRFQKVAGTYRVPAPAWTLDVLSSMYDCDFIVGIGLDRAKQLSKDADRTALVTVARGILDPERWGTDRIYFILDIFTPHDPSLRTIMAHIEEMVNMHGNGNAYVDLEDYNVMDLKAMCKELGIEVEIPPNSYKHQERIFTEMFNAFDGGYIKCPDVLIWSDDQDELHYEDAPIGRADLLRTELAAFEHHPPIRSDGGRGSGGYFGSPFKKNGRPGRGEPKDDVVYALAHAMNAATRGDLPASVKKAITAETFFNHDVIGAYL